MVAPQRSPPGGTPMRKIIVSMWTTLDGLVAGPDDEMDWLHPDDQMQAYENELVASADTLLLGRITHADFAGAWPEMAADPSTSDEVRAYARRVDSMAKMVVSKSGRTADWNNTELLPELRPQTVRSLKEQDGHDIVVYGSLSVVGTLAALGLVDEYHLLVHPTVLHEGKPLFAPALGAVSLGLLSADPFASGVVLMRYRPEPVPAATP
ncbi:MAG: dihydrofolate reductase [Propionibacteriales bacterium]|nr:dihydrofolate reductase [Propionibacteriales bacterium]